MKTVKYQKRCFDQIKGIVAENKALVRRWPRWVLRNSAVSSLLGV